MTTPKPIGVPNLLFAKPLIEALRTHANFRLVEETRPTIAKQLHEQELSAALLSPLDYAKESSDYRIVPNVAAVSRSGDSSIVVRFREGAKRITTLAVDPNFASEIVLAKIMLAESFDIEPTILPMIATPDVMVQKADAALLVGDAAFRARSTSERIIDIVEEWNEMTGLPFVHAMWCGREGALTKDDIVQIQTAATRGVIGIPDIVLEFPKEERDAFEHYLELFSYELTDDARESLAELMKYLYYHGILPDVAELNFYTTENPTDNFLADISPN